MVTTVRTEGSISAVADADTPPDPPFARVGKGSAGLVRVAQQNPVWTGAHDTSVKANFYQPRVAVRGPNLGGTRFRSAKPSWCSARSLLSSEHP